MVRLAVVAGGAGIARAHAEPDQALVDRTLERAIDLDEGKKVARDPAAAAALYQSAAGSGDSFAHLRLGYLYETGDGVPQDYELARSHYQAAVDAGLAAGHTRLAVCNLEGWGGPKDRDAFVRELQLGAEAGDVPAQRILAEIYFVGFAVTKNPVEGAAWMERAAGHDDADAQYSLGREAENIRRRALMGDVGLTRTWYQLSAEKEYVTAKLAMARTYLTGNRSDRNWEMGHKWLETATEGGDSEAPYILAVVELLHVDSPHHDEARAREWLELAAKRGNYRATEVLYREKGGGTLADAIRYVVNVPQDVRYVETAAAKATVGPTHAPQIIRVVRPLYPYTLRLARTEGQAMIDFTVDTKGQVLNPTIYRSTHPLFSGPALEAVRQWRFIPAAKDGHLVNCRMRVPIIFEMKVEALEGADQMLRWVYACAREQGPDVVADASDLVFALPTVPFGNISMPAGADTPIDASVVLIVALDASGRPLRSHIIWSSPKELGDAVAAVASTRTYLTTPVGKSPAPSNAIVVYATGKFAQRLLQ